MTPSWQVYTFLLSRSDVSGTTSGMIPPLRCPRAECSGSIHELAMEIWTAGRHARSARCMISQLTALKIKSRAYRFKEPQTKSCMGIAVLCPSSSGLVVRDRLGMNWRCLSYIIQGRTLSLGNQSRKYRTGHLSYTFACPLKDRRGILLIASLSLANFILTLFPFLNLFNSLLSTFDP